MRPLFVCLALLLVPALALAQDCNTGVYLDEAGTISDGDANSLHNGGAGQNIYIITRVEDFINAAAYKVNIPFRNVDVFVLGRSFGPDGDGLNIVTPNGDNIGLGKCVVAFNQFPVRIERFTLLAPDPTFNKSMTISISPNIDTDDKTVVYSTCQGVVKPCKDTIPLYLKTVSTESKSFGAVKALY